MRPLRVTLAYACVFHAFLAHAGESSVSAETVPLGELALPEHLVVTGAAAFPPESIAAALLNDTTVVLAAHPTADRSEFLRLVRKKIMMGYQRLGFPDAYVSMDLRGRPRRVVVRITEGQRSRLGEIRVQGNKSLPAQAILDKVTPPIRGDSGWAYFDASALDHLKGCVERAYAERGFFFPSITVQPLREEKGNVANLRIFVKDEGPLCTLESVEVKGCKKNSPQDVVRYLKLRTGATLTQGLVDGAGTALHRSGRFLRHKVSTERLEDNTGRMKLLIELTEFEKASALSQPLMQREEAFLRFRDWLDGFVAGKADYCLVYSGREPVPLTAVFSPTEGMVLWSDAPVASYTKEKIEALIVPDKMAIFRPDAGKRCVAPGLNADIRGQASIVACGDPKADTNFSMTFGFTVGGSRKEGEPAVSVEAELDPVAFLSFAHMDNTHYSLEGELLVVRKRGEDPLEIKIHRETGRLVHLVLMDQKTRQPIGTITLKPRGLQGLVQQMEARSRRYIECYDPRSPLASFVECAGEAVALETILADHIPGEQIPMVSRLLRESAASAGHSIWRLFHEEKGEDAGERFYSPALRPEDLGQTGILEFVTIIARHLAPVFPPDTWPRILAQDVEYASRGRRDYVRHDVLRILESDDFGPLGYALTVLALRAFDPELCSEFTYKGLEKVTPVSFRREYEMLLSVEALKELVDGTLEPLRELSAEEARKLSGQVPGGSGGAFASMAQLLRENRDSTPSSLLPRALDTWWKDALGNEMAAGSSRYFSSRGYYHFGRREYDRAIADYTKAVQVDPDNAKAFYGRGLAGQQKGDRAQAIRDYTRAIEINPVHAYAYHSRGIARRHSGSINLAIADYSKAIELRPDFAEAYFNRGLAHGYRDSPDRAIADFTKVIELRPTHAGAYAIRAYSYQSLAKFDLAKADYEKVVRLDPDSERGRHAAKRLKLFVPEPAEESEPKPEPQEPKQTIGKSKALRARKRRYKADSRSYDEKRIRDLTEAIEEGPEHAHEHLVFRGLAYEGLRNYDKAIADYDRAIQLKPGYAGAYTARGAARLDRGDYDRAIEDFTKSLAILKRRRTFYLRGQAHQLRGDLDRAIQDFGTAIGSGGRDALPAHVGRGICYLHKGDHERALKELNEAALIDDEHAPAYLWRAITHARKGDPERAVRDHTTHIEEATSKSLAHRERGRTYLYYAREPREAVEDFRRAVQLEPDDIRSGLWLYFGMEMAGMDGAAELRGLAEGMDAEMWPFPAVELMLGRVPPEEFTRSIGGSTPREAAERTCEAHFLLGKWYLLNGNRQRARQWYEKCVETGQRHVVAHSAAMAELAMLPAGDSRP